MATKVRALRSPEKKVFVGDRRPGMWRPAGTLSDMAYMDLNGAVFSNCVMRHINFAYADLSNASFLGCVMEYCVFDNANMQGVTIRSTESAAGPAVCYECSFADANLCKAMLADAVMHRAVFTGAKLRGADVGTDSIRSRFNESRFGGATGIPKRVVAACPVLPAGEFTAWKRCADGRIAKLKVPADAQRSSGLSNKCRASHVMTLDITSRLGRKCCNARSLLDVGGQDCAYRVGYVTEAHAFSTDRWETCAPGIHFFLTRKEACNFRMQ